ncbi:proline-rich receptor-like protein kinase PERK9 [Iris pallida]|uniref:Proline-rich receptor-like protein kinase PERK9 n=1 Tax=Iris pallida TaxID=29817 RepID=A0AAX6HMT7_IRIPA|nr:proline-rich receptor-like protein kinase PERK9 [Iris pallida]
MATDRPRHGAQGAGWSPPAEGGDPAMSSRLWRFRWWVWWRHEFGDLSATMALTAARRCRRLESAGNERKRRPRRRGAEEHARRSALAMGGAP